MQKTLSNDKRTLENCQKYESLIGQIQSALEAEKQLLVDTNQARLEQIAARNVKNMEGRSPDQ